MRFYIVQDSGGSVVGATQTLREARAIADTSSLATIEWVEVPITAESVRRLLAEGGGYAEQYSEDIVYLSPEKTR